MRPRSSGTLRMILQAAARVLGCNSAQIALVDGDSLVLRLSVTNAEQPMLKDVELKLGFAAEGASLPLSSGGSVMTRAVREGRLLVSARFGDLAGSLIPEPVSEQIESLLGPNTFAT